MTADTFHFLDYGALGAAILVLLIAVAVLYRVLLWARELMDLVLTRVEANTRVLAQLTERLGAHEEGR